MALQFQMVWLMLDAAVFLCPHTSRFCHDGSREKQGVSHSDFRFWQWNIYYRNTVYPITEFQYYAAAPTQRNSIILGCLQNFPKIRSRISNYSAPTKPFKYVKGTGTRDLIWLKVVSLERSWWVGLTEDLCFFFIFFINILKSLVVLLKSMPIANENRIGFVN